MPLDKVRIRFRKSGELRLVSHLDLMRSLERLLRRASLPFHMTGGFHPTPRLVLAQSLSLGITGQSEVAELELTEEIDPPAVLDRLRAQAPRGLDFLSCVRIPFKTTGRPRRAVYLIPADPTPELRARCDAFLAATEVWADRERPRPRQVNIRNYVESLTLVPEGVRASIWLTQDGTTRADELAGALGITDTTAMERLELELADEVSAEEAARTPRIEPQTRPLTRPISADPGPTAPTETWGATANGPVVE
ncbi:MAG TPA: TIGR03936 family radical SAM-associated protein [Gemmataceae bacterium]|jgi:radical SAM-linked protein|nr:TIGR03936 family radical SAM-associated protein [Gemmataceae bacterium]